MNEKNIVAIAFGVAAGLITIGIADGLMAKSRTRDMHARIRAFQYIMHRIADGDYNGNTDAAVADYDYFHKLETQIKE